MIGVYKAREGISSDPNLKIAELQGAAIFKLGLGDAFSSILDTYHWSAFMLLASILAKWWGSGVAAPESTAIFSNLEFEEMPCLAILDIVSLHAPIQYPITVMA